MKTNTQTKAQTKAEPATTAPPPLPPDGKPIAVGATTATVNRVAGKAGKPTVTLRLKRLIKAPPERIYKAFLDPDALAKWIPPDGFVGHVESLDARVGGKYRMNFSTVNKSWVSWFGGTYSELVPNRRIVHTDAFESDDPNMQGTMTVTIDLKPVPGGTEVHVTQEGIPLPVAGGSPYGWAQSFDNLARLCEPELPF